MKHTNSLQKSNLLKTDSQKYLFYMSIIFSLFINGLFLTIIGTLPKFIDNSEENLFRIYTGAILIGIGFIIVPNISRESKDKFLLHLAFSMLSILFLFIEILYWIKHYQTNNLFADLFMIMLAIIDISYIFYFLFHFFKCTYLISRKIIQKLYKISKKKKKSALQVILEYFTAILLALSSFVTAFWAAVTAIRTFL